MFCFIIIFLNNKIKIENGLPGLLVRRFRPSKTLNCKEAEIVINNIHIYIYIYIYYSYN